MKITTYLCFVLCCFNLLSQSETELPLEIIVQRGHDRPVTCSGFSSDGKYVASGSKDFSVKLWEVKSGLEIRSFSHHSQAVLDLEFSPNDEAIVSVAWDSKVVLQEAKTGKLIWIKDFGEISPRSVAFSSDGKFVMVSTNRDHFFVLDALTGQERLNEKKPFSSGVFRESMSPQNNVTLVRKGYGEFLIIDVASGKALFALSPDKPRNFSFSYDSRFLIVGSSKLLTEVFDLDTGEKIHTLKSDQENRCDGCGTLVKSMHTKNLFISGSDENGFTVWNPKTGKNKQTIHVNKQTTGIDIGSVRHIEISYDDQYVLFQSSRALVVYNLKSKSFIHSYESFSLDDFKVHFSPVSSAEILLPDEHFSLFVQNIFRKTKKVVFHGYLNRARKTGKKSSYSNWIGASTINYLRRKTSLGISPDNKWVVKGGIDSTVFVIDFKTGQLKKKLQGHTKLVYLFEFSKDGKWLASAGEGREIIIWNTNTWEIKSRLKGHVGSLYDLHFNSSCSELISTSWDGTIRIWDTSSLKMKAYYGNEKNIASYTAAYLPGELYFIHGDINKKIKIVERNTGSTFKELVGHTGVLSGVDFDQETGDVFTCSWDGMVKGWSLGSQMMKFSIKPHNESVYSMKYDQKSKWLLTGGADNEIQIYDVSRQKVVARLKGHNAQVTCIKVSNDRKYILSSGIDGEIKVWSYDTFEELYGYNQINSTDWLVTNPSGYFDGSKNALQLINYVKGLKVVPISSLFNKYYTPNLSKRIMNGEVFVSSTDNFSREINAIPEIKVSWSKKDNFLVVTDSAIHSKANKVFVDFSVFSNSQAQHLVRVYRNGKLIHNVFVSKSSNLKETQFPIRLKDGVNDLSFVAINENKTISASKHLIVHYDGLKGKTDLYVLALGLNKYQNPEYDLNFAIDDAEAFSKRLIKGSDTLFNKTYSYVLKNAVKEDISSAIDEIAKVIGPEDVFVFFYAGHGVMRYEADSSEFFLVLKNVTSMHGDYVALVDKGFSAHDLMNVSKVISAEKQLYVLDACNSGGVLQTMAYRGAEKEKALAQLAHSTGTFYLTASQDIQYANEAWKLKHGVFTYCLLEVLSGEDEATAQDFKITVSELKSYVESRVPVVSKENQGLTQYPTSFGFGQDFPLIILK